MKIAIVLAVIAALSGCVNTAKKLNHLSLGMTKPEVMEILGEPDETAAAHGVEYMLYELRSAPGAGTQTACGVGGLYTLGLIYLAKDCQYSDKAYFVQLREGKVSAYGKPGDFDSTQKPEATINVNQRIEQVPPSTIDAQTQARD